MRNSWANKSERTMPGKRSLHPEVSKYFQELGAKGGKTTVKRHSRKEMVAWGKLGGRPPAILTKIIACLESGPKTARDVAAKIHAPIKSVCFALHRLRKTGRAIAVRDSDDGTRRVADGRAFVYSLNPRKKA